MNNFLPDGYENLRTEKKYWKMSEMKDGENRLRIVAKPVAGWIEWKDKKPMRYRPDQKPFKAIDEENPPKPFWVLHVWDYQREDLFILEVNQSGVIKQLMSFANDSDWGDFTAYDIKVKKKGSGLETRYSLTPVSHKPLADNIKQAIKRSPVRLEALYDGKDPWTDLQPSYEEMRREESPSVVTLSSSGSAIERLYERMQGQNTPVDRLMDFVNLIASKQEVPVEKIINAFLAEKAFSHYLKRYSEYLSSFKDDSEKQIA